MERPRFTRPRSFFYLSSYFNSLYCLCFTIDPNRLINHSLSRLPVPRPETRSVFRSLLNRIINGSVFSFHSGETAARLRSSLAEDPRCSVLDRGSVKRPLLRHSLRIPLVLPPGPSPLQEHRRRGRECRRAVPTLITQL